MSDPLVIEQSRGTYVEDLYTDPETGVLYRRWIGPPYPRAAAPSPFLLPLRSFMDTIAPTYAGAGEALSDIPGTFHKGAETLGIARAPQAAAKLAGDTLGAFAGSFFPRLSPTVLIGGALLAVLILRK